MALLSVDEAAERTTSAHRLKQSLPYISEYRVLEWRYMAMMM